MTTEQINQIAETLSAKINVAYKPVAELLGNPYAIFVSTTNTSFENRVGVPGQIQLSRAVIEFFAFGKSMHTSYVTKLHYDSTTNMLTVTTRNSTYIFELKHIDKTSFTWSLPADLQKQYEDFLSSNFETFL